MRRDLAPGVEDLRKRPADIAAHARRKFHHTRDYNTLQKLAYFSMPWIGAVIVLMLWLVVTSFAIILGAEINSELEAQTAKDSTVGRAEPMGTRGAVKADTLGEPAG